MDRFDGLGRWVTRSHARWAAFVLAVVVVTRLPGLLLSFVNPDEATYSALGARIAQGFAPYTGAIDHKPPGIALIYAAVYALAGAYDLVAVRLLLIAVVAATALAIGELAVARRGVPAARIAGLVYAVASAYGVADDVQAANTELFAALPLVLAGLAVARGGGRRAVLAGALVGVATLIRYQSGLVGAAFAVALVLDGGAPRRALRGLAGLAAGFAAVAAAFATWLWATDALAAYRFWGWDFNFIYIAVLTPSERIANALWGSAGTALWWLPVFLVIRRPRGAFELAWLIAALAGVATGGRFYFHYYLAVLPPLCLATDWTRVRPRTLPAFAAVSAVAFALAFAQPRLDPGRAAEDRVYRAIGEAVRARSDRDDRIFVWGDSPAIYHYADRVMGSRFAFCNYHTGRMWGSHLVDARATGTERYVVPQAMPALLADLTTAPPALIIDGGAGRLNRFDLHPIARYAELARFVATHYRLASVVAGVPVYALRTH